MGDLQHHKCQSYEDIQQLKHQKCLVYYSTNLSKGLEQNETCFMEVDKSWECCKSPSSVPVHPFRQKHLKYFSSIDMFIMSQATQWLRPYLLIKVYKNWKNTSSCEKLQGFHTTYIDLSGFLELWLDHFEWTVLNETFSLASAILGGTKSSDISVLSSLRNFSTLNLALLKYSA